MKLVDSCFGPSVYSSVLVLELVLSSRWLTLVHRSCILDVLCRSICSALLYNLIHVYLGFRELVKSWCFELIRVPILKLNDHLLLARIYVVLKTVYVGFEAFEL